MPASHPPRFSELPQEVLQQVAASLGDEDRVAMMGVCTRWAAAIEAAPALWPTAALTLEPTRANEVALRRADYAPSWGSVFNNAPNGNGDVFDAMAADHVAVMQLVARAAALSPHYLRVRVEGDELVKPSVAFAVVSVLPPSVRALELDIPCTGPLPFALLRLHQLRQLSLRTSGLDWWGRGSAFVVPRLVHLALDYHGQPVWDAEGFFLHAHVRPLESSLPAGLSPATGLTSLELRICGSQHLSAVLSLLPALRELSLDLYQYESDHVLQAAQALQQLPLLSLSLGVHSYFGTEATAMEAEWLDSEHYPLTVLPPMAGLQLTALRLLGHLGLPPDVHKLEHLRSLYLHTAYEIASWGDTPLACLAALSRLQAIQTVLPDAALLAAAPSLAEVHAPDGLGLYYGVWRRQLAALRPDVHITPDPQAEAAA